MVYARVNLFVDASGSREELTGDASPPGDVAGVVVRQNLSRGGQGSQLHVGVQSGLRGQLQQGNVISGGGGQ